MLSLLWFVLILSFLVIIHELGHFLAARKAKIRVEEFGLGYPPLALKLFTWRKTVFTLNWIPFGGFVKMEGEEQAFEEVDHLEKGWGPFYAKSAWARLGVVLAGVAVNFFFGIMAFSIVFMQWGIPHLVTADRISALAYSPRLEAIQVGETKLPVHSVEEATQILTRFEQQVRVALVVPESPAGQAGLQPNTILLALKTATEELTVQDEKSTIEFIGRHQGEEVRVTTSLPCRGVSCEGQQEFLVRLRKADQVPEGQGSLGVAFDPGVALFYPWYDMIWQGTIIGTQQALALSWAVVAFLGHLLSTLLFKLKLVEGVSTVFGIGYETQKTGILTQSWVTALNFAGMLSVNLAVINLMPFPALDGGRAVFICLEKLLGRRRIAKIENHVNQWGMILLLSLIVVISARDIWRIFLDLRG